MDPYSLVTGRFTWPRIAEALERQYLEIAAEAGAMQASPVVDAGRAMVRG